MAGAVANQTSQESIGAATNVLTIPTRTVGNMLVLLCVNNQGSVSSVVSSGGTGTTWTLLLAGGSNEALDIYWATAPGTDTTVTVTIPASGTSVVKIIEVSGLTGVGDGTSSATGTSASPSSGSVTPTVNNDFIVGFAGHFNAPSAGPTNGFTALSAIGSGMRLTAAYLNQGAAAAISTSWTVVSEAWDGVIAAFKTTAAAAGLPPQVLRITSRAVARAANW